jgi:hypothetical protein
MTKATILQILASDTLQMLVGFVLFVVVARLVMRALNRDRDQPESRTTANIKLPPLPPMDFPESAPTIYASSRGMGIAEAPALPEIPLSPEQRQKAAEWLEKNPL